jgi:hypothetical protein
MCNGAVATPKPDQRVDVLAAGIWISGIAVFHASAQWTPHLGAAIPSLIVTFALAMATRPTSPKTAAE